MGFKVQAEVSDQDVAGLICCGFEGGVGYWCRIVGYEKPTEIRPVIDAGMDNPQVFKHNDYPLLPGGAVLCQAFEDYDEEDEEGYYCDSDTGERKPVLRLDRESVQKGLKVMQEKYPRHFADFMQENTDACTGDVFIQCCLLGELVYG